MERSAAAGGDAAIASKRGAGGGPQLLSAHLVEGGPAASLRLVGARPEPTSVPGLIWAQTALTTAFPVRLPPRPTGAALLAAWEDERALDGFLAEHPLARRLAHGWQVRLQPLRAYGAWPELPGLGQPEQPVADDEPVVVVTLGRVRLRRVAPFVRASSPAERQAVQDPAALLVAGLARPPRIVSTFSVWRSAREMRDYTIGRSGNAHLQAMQAHQRNPFHHDSVFARFRPYAARGSFHGLSPLTEHAAPAVAP